ncbi:DUF120 domain-containing protein [Candidatus Undinarchaeota archaeon]
MSFAGVVRSGKGEAADFISMTEYVKQFTKILGYTPFSMALNLQVTPQVREHLKSLTGERVEGFIKVNTRKKDMVGDHSGAKCIRVLALEHGDARTTKCAVIFPDNQREDEEIISVIGPLNLRAALDVEEGDIVTIHP